VASFELDDIPVSAAPFPTTGTILAARTTETPPFEYSVLVRLRPPFHVGAAMIAPDGARTDVIASVE